MCVSVNITLALPHPLCMYPRPVLTSSLSRRTVCDPREGSKGKSGTVQRNPPLAPASDAAGAPLGVAEEGRLVIMTLRGLSTAITCGGGDMDEPSHR